MGKRIKNLYYYKKDAMRAAHKRAAETGQRVDHWKADNIGSFERIGDDAEIMLESVSGECAAFWVGDDVYAYWCVID